MKLTKSARPITVFRVPLSHRTVTLLAVEPDREGVVEASERDADLSLLDLGWTDALLEGDLRLVSDHSFVPHTWASHIIVARHCAVRFEFDFDIIPVRGVHIQSGGIDIVSHWRQKVTHCPTPVVILLRVTSWVWKYQCSEDFIRTAQKWSSRS